MDVIIIDEKFCLGASVFVAAFTLLSVYLGKGCKTVERLVANMDFRFINLSMILLIYFFFPSVIYIMFAQWMSESFYAYIITVLVFIAFRFFFKLVARSTLYRRSTDSVYTDGVPFRMIMSLILICYAIMSKEDRVVMISLLILASGPWVWLDGITGDAREAYKIIKQSPGLLLAFLVLPGASWVAVNIKAVECDPISFPASIIAGAVSASFLIYINYDIYFPGEEWMSAKHTFKKHMS